MSNQLTIKSDEINVYATLRVRSKFIGKLVLSILVFGLIVFYVFLALNVNNENAQILVFFLLVFGFIIFFPIKYLLWNLYGNEILIVNTKSISYSYYYGLFKTNLKTINHERLGLSFEFVKLEDKIEKGKLNFYNYNNSNNLPVLIHQTTVLINKKEIELLELAIQKLFKSEIDENNIYSGFSLN